jgi:hypothetical protein
MAYSKSKIKILWGESTSHVLAHSMRYILTCMKRIRQLIFQLTWINLN